MADIDPLEEMSKQQLAFQKQMQEQIGNAIATMMNTVNDTPVQRDDIGVDYGVVNNPDLVSQINDLAEKIRVLESAVIGYQLPISFRYRNDGAEGVGAGIHRHEYIIKGTPYSTGTTEWPDDEWTAIPGADAEVYS